jgi:hypothetical protein
LDKSKELTKFSLVYNPNSGFSKLYVQLVDGTKMFFMPTVETSKNFRSFNAHMRGVCRITSHNAHYWIDAVLRNEKEGRVVEGNILIFPTEDDDFSDVSSGVYESKVKNIFFSPIDINLAYTEVVYVEEN